MSFSSETKRELCQVHEQEACCERAEVYGLMLFSHILSAGGNVYRTKHEYLARTISEKICSCCGVCVECSSPERGDGMGIYSLSMPYPDQRISAMKEFGYSGNETSIRLKPDNYSSDCCRRAFLRGAFLAGGKITDPQNDYHLEFVAQHKNLCDDFCAFLREEGLRPRVIVRNGSYVVYFKDKESLDLVLSEIGASKAYLKLMEVTVYRDCKNVTQRRYNCDSANIAKTANAAGAQIAAIRYIEAKAGLDSLSDELRELALLRLENPGMTLRELSDALSTPLTRSGVNHRIKKLMEISSQLHEDEKRRGSD